MGISEIATDPKTGERISEEVFTQKIKARAYRQILFFGLWLLAGITIVLIAWMAPFELLKTNLSLPGDENLGGWFSRSGAMLCVFGLLAEGCDIKVRRMLTATFYAERGQNKARKDLKPLTDSLPVVAFGMMAAGTFIWGFGDLLVHWFK